MGNDVSSILRELVRFRSSEPIDSYTGRPRRNIFWPVNEGQILRAEERMGFPFPTPLRSFYQMLGYGKLIVSRSEAKVCEDQNLILPPDEVAERYLRETDAINVFPELWDDDELPFFNFSDSSCLVMRPRSDRPDTVYWTGESQPVAPDFVTFLERLYEDPEFYLDEDEQPDDG